MTSPNKMTPKIEDYWTQKEQAKAKQEKPPPFKAFIDQQSVKLL